MAEIKNDNSRSNEWPKSDEILFNENELQQSKKLFQQAEDYRLNLDSLEALLLKNRFPIEQIKTGMVKKLPSDKLEVERALTTIKLLKDLGVKSGSTEEKIGYWFFKLALHCDRANIGHMPSYTALYEGREKSGKDNAVPSEIVNNWQTIAKQVVASGKSQKEAIYAILDTKPGYEEPTIKKHIKGIKPNKILKK